MFYYPPPPLILIPYKWSFSVRLCTGVVKSNECVFDMTLLCVCLSQGHSRLHGSRGSSEGDGVRQQRRLVLLRLHALQTPARVTTPAPLISSLSSTSPSSVSRLPVRFQTSSATRSKPLWMCSPPVWCVFDLVCVCGRVCVFVWSGVCKCQRS